MKKQIIFISLALCVLSARATVQPIHPGENLWKIISRLGTTVDIIESCFDVLETNTLDCTQLITQDDIPYTITAPGVYCLAENVQLDVNQTDTAITIQTECVELNLCGHAIDGGRTGIWVDGNSISTSPANVIIQNGLIKNAAVDCISVEEVTGPVKLSNLKATGAADGSGFLIFTSLGITVEQCESSENTINGFWVTGESRQCVFNNCIARKNVKEGFLVEGADDAEGDEDCCFTGCKGFGNGGFANFYVTNASHNVFIDCVATGATKNGFRLIGENDRDNVFFHCVANNNTRDGFQINSAKYNVIRDCVSNNNNRAGIWIFQAAFNQVMGCSCVGNVGVGIEDDPGNSFIINNIAHDNNAGGAQYSGINLDAIESVVTFTTGYWANVAG